MSRAATRTLHLNVLGFYDVERPNVGLDPAVDGVLSVWANEFEAFHRHLLRLGSWANGDAPSTNRSLVGRSSNPEPNGPQLVRHFVSRWRTAAVLEGQHISDSWKCGKEKRCVKDVRQFVEGLNCNGRLVLS